MKHTGIPIPGYRIDKKTGKPVKEVKHLDVSKKIAQRKSNKVRVKK